MRAWVSKLVLGAWVSCGGQVERAPAPSPEPDITAGSEGSEGTAGYQAHEPGGKGGKGGAPRMPPAVGGGGCGAMATCDAFEGLGGSY